MAIAHLVLAWFTVASAYAWSGRDLPHRPVVRRTAVTADGVLRNAAPLVAPFTVKDAETTWFHIPKCGTSFGSPFLAASCSHARRDLQASNGCAIGQLLCHCNACGCSGCLTMNLVGFHIPYQPKKGYRYAGMFRNPEKRIISQYMYSNGFGRAWGNMTELAEHMKSLNSGLTSKERFLEYATHPSTKSCQTKMLLGFACVSNIAITTEMTLLAITRVREDFAFVGDTDLWEGSLHQLFPHGLPDFALHNNRPGEAKGTERGKANAELYLEALHESNWHDTPDEQIYHEVGRLMAMRASHPDKLRIAHKTQRRDDAWWAVDSFVEMDVKETGCNEQLTCKA